MAEQPGDGVLVRIDESKLKRFVEHVRRHDSKCSEGFVEGLAGTRVVKGIIAEAGFGPNQRVKVELWGQISDHALNTPEFWNLLQRRCRDKGLLKGMTFWEYGTLQKWLQCVRFIDEHEDVHGRKVANANSHADALRFIVEYNREKKKKRAQEATATGSVTSRWKRTTAPLKQTCMEEQATKKARGRRKKAKGRYMGKGEGEAEESEGGTDDERGPGRASVNDEERAASDTQSSEADGKVRLHLQRRQ